MAQYLPVVPVGYSVDHQHDQPFEFKDLLNARITGQSSCNTLSKFIQDPYYGMCPYIKDWIKLHEEEAAAAISEEEASRMSDNDQINDISEILQHLDENIKYDIMEFIPTFSRWKQFEREEDYLKNQLKFPKAIVRVSEKRCDSNFVTFHKMRIVSKSFNRRMIVKLLNLDQVFINVESPNSEKKLIYYYTLFREQAEYVKRNRTLPDSYLLIYEYSKKLDEAVKKPAKKDKLFDGEHGIMHYDERTKKISILNEDYSSNSDDDNSDDDPFSKMPTRKKNLFESSDEDDDPFTKKPLTRKKSLFDSSSDDDDENPKDSNQSFTPAEKETPFKRTTDSQSLVINKTHSSTIPENMYNHGDYENAFNFKQRTIFNKPNVDINFTACVNTTIKHLIICGEGCLKLTNFENLKTLTHINYTHSRIEIPESIEKVYQFKKILNHPMYNFVKPLSGKQVSKIDSMEEVIRHLRAMRCVSTGEWLEILSTKTNSRMSLFSFETLLDDIIKKCENRNIFDFLFTKLQIPIELVSSHSLSIDSPVFQYIVYLSNKYQDGRMFNILSDVSPIKIEEAIVFGLDFKKHLFELSFLPFSQSIINTIILEHFNIEECPDYFQSLLMHSIPYNQIRRTEEIVGKLVPNPKILSQVVSGMIKSKSSQYHQPIISTFSGFMAEFLLEIVDVEIIGKIKNERGDNILHILLLQKPNYQPSMALFNFMKKLRHLVYEKNNLGQSPLDLLVKGGNDSFVSRMVLSEFQNQKQQ